MHSPQIVSIVFFFSFYLRVDAPAESPLLFFFFFKILTNVSFRALPSCVQV